MNEFTEENTKDAIGYHAGCKSSMWRPHFVNAASETLTDGDDFGWCRSIHADVSSRFVLYRHLDETRDHWTTNGVTQYAQPQGNEMNIDWIEGAEYYKANSNEFYRMPSSGNYAEYYSHKHQAWRVTGQTPVSNLSRSYFIKRLEWPSCDSQENIGPGVDFSELPSVEVTMPDSCKQEILSVMDFGAVPDDEPDSVKNPKHHQLMSGVESIEIIARAMTTEQWHGYCLGNIIKYRLRAGKKDKLEQDIAKADFYSELFDIHKGKCIKGDDNV